MAIGFPPSSEERRQYDLSDRLLLRAVEDALEELRWAHSRESRWRYTATIGMQIFVSYGEKIAVTVEEDGWVRCRSECSYPLQWIDWGRNSSNVRKFFVMFEEMVDELESRRARRRDDDDE